AFMLSLLLAPAGARAQSVIVPEPSPVLPPAVPPVQSTATAAVPDPDGPFNYVDFGARGTSFGAGSNEALYQRYRDLRNGATLDVVHYDSENDQRRFSVRADHVGYRDQHYYASYNQFGKWKASFEWNQIPLFFSETTSTFYTSPTQGTLLIADPIQAGL